MPAIMQILQSKKGLFACVVEVAATVLTVMGKLSVEQWVSMTTWVSGFYLGGQAIVDAAKGFKSK